MKDTIGFIGLGSMGGGMAANLARADFKVVGMDIDARRTAALAEKGGTIVATPAEVARAAKRVVTMVETTAQTEQIIMGENGVLAGAGPGHAIAMMSTIDPIATKRMHDTLQAKGITMVDAPVSGGSGRAADGSLAIICGGDSADFEGWLPAFKAMSANQFHVGSIGQGLALKLVNNMLIQTSTVAIAEAFVMGAKAGLDPKVMYDVIRVSTGASFALDFRVPRFLSGDFSPGGTVDISYKDQELETAFGKALGVPLFMANISQQIYQMARAQGLNKQDGASVVKLYEQMAGVKLGPR
ncbi:MAG: NAD(P)-dependent oxidoreductase [Hyphomicrobiaceae bacterium]|nr:NAD(P)-dependent oxidoreductase [Hyphomicrobiaceae bacterium]